MSWHTRLWLWWRTQLFPSHMQRLHNQGDPTGEVRAFADKVVKEMRDEGTWE
jgi:hypothetical protein